MSEEYWGILEDVRSWQLEFDNPEITLTEVDPWWEGFFRLVGKPGELAYDIYKDQIDPFIGALKTFFNEVYYWITDKWFSLWSWLHEISAYIESLWNTLAASAAAIYVWIGDRIESLMNMINNWGVMVWEWLISDIWRVVDYLVNPLLEIWDYLTATLAEWFERIQAALSSFMSDPLQWVYDLGGLIWDSLTYLAGQIWTAMVDTANVASAWIGEKITALAPQVTEYLRDVLEWFWDWIKTAFIFIKDEVVPAIYEATSGALGYLKDEFSHIMGLVYDEILGYAKRYTPMTPERAPELAGLMFGTAVGMGTLAHSIALAVEAIPNLKYMGVHYLSAFASRMGSFGMISSATMGVIAATSVKAPFQYYMKSLLRPTQPRAGDLMMMAVKPDIPIDIFRKGMAYEGYSNYWIDAFQRTMYNEPRYFELSMMGEDESATNDWLFTKARRSGYSEEDSHVFVSSLLKKVTRTQRQDYYKQAFNLFKEGYIDKARFEDYLDALQMRAEAKELAVRAAEFAYRFDMMRDLVGAYRSAYRNDLITQEEFTGSLSALGLEPERVDTLVYIEWVKKTPSAVRKEAKEAEKAWAEVQKEYTHVYIESFQKGLITEEQLTAYLVAIGIVEEVAKATARYEALKLLPNPEIPEISTPSIPPPPTPPELTE